jgi:hypothetical protein
MYQCLLPLEEIRLSTKDIDRSLLHLRNLQLSDEKHGNQACHIGTHWLLSSHNILISNDRSERYDDRKSAGPICLYPGVYLSRNVIVRLRFPPACFSDDADLPSIDILASKLVVTNHIHESSSQRSRQQKNLSNRRTKNGLSDISMYPVSHIETRVDAHGLRSSSQELIIEGTPSHTGTNKSSEEVDEYQGKNGAITKTVEFDFHDSSA